MILGNMKKKIVWCSVILLIVTVAVVIFVGRNNVPERIFNILTENRDAYDYVVEFYYADFLADKQYCAALVYSIDGTKPKFVNTPDDEFSKVSSAKVVDNWYYVTGE